MDKHFLNELNDAYSQLETKKTEITDTLSNNIFKLESGWYNGHYARDESGNWFRESYPILVIEVKGLCDIEIEFDKISVSTKLKRETALNYSFKEFTGFDFEAYGVENYLADFYHFGQTIQDMKENILACDEKEIGFSFVFPFDIGKKEIFDFILLLHTENFFY